MNGIDVLTEGFGRLDDLVATATSDLTEDQLAERVGPEANTVAWLVWHLAREQDAQVAALGGTEEVWTADGWAEKLALPLDPSDNGYGNTPEQVAQVRASADLLVGYARASTAASLAYLRGLSDADLDDVVDPGWDPPVTRGVRLLSVLDDAVQHAGQAAFVRGLLLDR
ncbi:mycothiol transferase [Cellulomonas triticagri]|uniref:DUF664 domain-containing protein n=1 Tax=Cellulomonas triticagri TaxID=2483352 RepID=A0A3M2JNW1_9CELL|nr:DUF664 domain-containing protein [Cellulomonas triticagri]RMI13530.1 DUF664 domain-containing protein [Cellulomonas triticagri]